MKLNGITVYARLESKGLPTKTQEIEGTPKEILLGIMKFTSETQFVNKMVFTMVRHKDLLKRSKEEMTQEDMEIELEGALGLLIQENDEESDNAG